MRMKPIQLPEPPSPTAARGTPDIFESGVHTLVRRAVVIGNGFPSSENHSIGLLRALGLSHNHLLYRVTRPRGGIDDWLHWLPLSLHRKIHYLISMFRAFSSKSHYLPLTSHPNGLSSILEADANHIVNLARETCEKEGPLLVVASGRDTISVASSIKRLAPDLVFVVQCLKSSPRVKLSVWLTNVGVAIAFQNRSSNLLSWQGNFQFVFQLLC